MRPIIAIVFATALAALLPSADGSSLFISEVAPWSSGDSPFADDWFEVTNGGATAVDITGWRMDDNHDSFAASVPLSGITTIAPGESVIFIESSNRTASTIGFVLDWFNGIAPANLQIGNYSGSNVGLGTSGDAVNLYNSAGVLQTSVVFGTSTPTPNLQTFDNSAGLTGVTISTLSVVGVNGAFKSANPTPGYTETGSPGTITNPITSNPTASPTKGPTLSPTAVPTLTPTIAPTASPTTSPTSSPTKAPTTPPTKAPTAPPTTSPTSSPTKAPTPSPTKGPTSSPTKAPNNAPTSTPTSTPTKAPTAPPTLSPVTPKPTSSPTKGPSKIPTSSPTKAPTSSPTKAPTASPTKVPTASPTKAPTSPPSKGPTASPTKAPTKGPTASPTNAPTKGPTASPTKAPTLPTNAVTLFISEVAPWSSGDSPFGDDWFEVTNGGSTPVDITGWTIDDNSNSSSLSVPLSGITTIAPGESVIFIESSNRTASTIGFVLDWFNGNAPSGLQIGNYSGAGVGLGTSGDQVNLFNSAGAWQTGVAFGVSTPTPNLQTFDNSAGLTGVTISTLSVVGVNGAFNSANPTPGYTETGSPGTIGKSTITTTLKPTSSPTPFPTSTPTKAPTAPPNNSPITSIPTSSPTKGPSKSPTLLPTKAPTPNPTKPPTAPPTSPGGLSIFISEVAPWSSGDSPFANDWFEVTNGGATTVDITGWMMDDNSDSFALSVPLSGITHIAPGESVIFIENSDLAAATTGFVLDWFNGNAPSGLQIGNYSGAGVGLSTSGDAVNLFNAAGVPQASVTFGASTPPPTLQTFDNSAGLNGVTISTLSVVGVNGAFNSANPSPGYTETGSPGTVKQSTTPTASSPTTAPVKAPTSTPTKPPATLSSSVSVFISEVAPWSSSSSPFANDWFEVTNGGATTVDITGWMMDDNSDSFALSVPLSGITHIAPGESVIFIENSNLAAAATGFVLDWFNGNAPSGLQIGNYSGAGVGLSTSGDAVNLFNAAGVPLASVTFGASTPPPNLQTFDNSAGLNGIISTLSVVGVNGAFNSANPSPGDTETGSPGKIGKSTTPTTSKPTSSPTKGPSASTPTAKSPTSSPNLVPVKAPTSSPTKRPTTPSSSPTKRPTVPPVKLPPTKSPTKAPAAPPHHQHNTNNNAKSGLNFFTFGDWGDNVATSPIPFEEGVIAKQINKYADQIKPSFFAVLGDNFYNNGVVNTTDPLWTNYYTSIYTSSGTFVPWYPVFGNHDYYAPGSPQAQIDFFYQYRDTRWTFPDYQYTRKWSIPGTQKTLEMVFINTVALCPEVSASNIGWPTTTQAITLIWQPVAQWIKNTLEASTADYLLVSGHYNVYSNTQANDGVGGLEYNCLASRLVPLMQEYGVASYTHGHEHALQHHFIDGIHYINSGHGSDKADPLLPGTPPGCLFNRTVGGFAYAHAGSIGIDYHFIDESGAYIYNTTITSPPRRRHLMAERAKSRV